MSKYSLDARRRPPNHQASVHPIVADAAALLGRFGGAAAAPECGGTKPWLVAPFRPISLAKLDDGSAMLERLDNKYVVGQPALQHAIAPLSEHFDILEIEGRRAFTYETCYFDDARYSSYFDHHQGRRQRYKVRVRKYTDTQACFVEVKLKDKRGITVKKRLDHPMDKYGALDDRAMLHIQSAYGQLYGRDFELELKPVLEIRYQRVTLAAKNGGERMTIDSGLVFSGLNRTHPIKDSIYIIETKSANGNGIADKIMRGLHQHPTSHCSKYCIGAALLRVVDRHNNFLPALRKVESLPQPRSELGLTGEHLPTAAERPANPLWAPGFAT